jgi:hypothetical protein
MTLFLPYKRILTQQNMRLIHIQYKYSQAECYIDLTETNFCIELRLLGQPRRELFLNPGFDLLDKVSGPDTLFVSNMVNVSWIHSIGLTLKHGAYHRPLAIFWTVSNQRTASQLDRE